MLLRDLNRDLNPNIVKAIAEIYLDLEGNSSPHSRQLSVDLGNNINFGDDGFACLVQYLVSNKYTGNIESLLYKIKTYLVVHGIPSICRDYVHINKQYNILRSKVNSKVNVKHNDYDFDRILDLFIEFFNSNCLDAYDWDTAGFGAFITNAFNKMFLSKYFTEVCAIVNERSTSIEVDGSTLDLEDKLVIENTTSFSSFNFRRDVKYIHEASKLLFPINPKNPNELYSDLMAAYKYYTTEKKKPDLAKHISNVFCPGATYYKSSNFLASSGYFTSILTEGPNDQTIEYRRFTFIHRLQMTEKLFDFMNSEMTGESIKNLYEYLVNLDISIADNKNKSKLFSVSDINSSFDCSVNKSRFDVLLSGIIGFKSLLEYCVEKGISIYSIPRDVFSTPHYYKRFVDLKQCLSCYDVTSSLINNAKSSKITSLLTNDETYDDLIAKSDFNFLAIQSCLSNDCQGSNKINPSNFLPVIEEILNDFASLYQRYLSYIKDTYSDDYDKASYMLSLPEDNGRDTELYNLVTEITGNHLGEFDKVVVNNDLPLAVCRYGWLKVFTLDRLYNNLVHLNSNSRFDILLGLSENKLLPLPTSIDTLDDLQIVNSNIPLHVDGVVTSSILNQFRTLYSVIQRELSGVVSDVNNLIEEKERELKSIGIKPTDTITISEDLQRASSFLYDSAIRHPNQSLEMMLTLDRVKLEHGFVTYRSKLYYYKGYLVHEYGFLIMPSADPVLIITPDMIIFDEGSV